MKRILFSLLLLASFFASAQNNSFNWINIKWLNQQTYIATGTNTYSSTIAGLTPKINDEIKVLFTNGNTGASTFNGVTMRKNGGSALSSGDILPGATYRLTYDGTFWQVLGISGGGGGSTSWASITDTPTTISGYGITDFYSLGNNRWLSYPGLDWASYATPTTDQWSSVCYGNGLFVAISNSGTDRVMTSPDGEIWTIRTGAEPNNWTSITYGNGLFVAIASSGTNRIMTSPDGITWTPRTAAQANSWQDVTYGNGLFVAIAASGTNRIMTSPDGITWTPRTAPDAINYTSITYGPSGFVGTSSSGTISQKFIYSADGVSWFRRTAPANNAWADVAYGNGKYVAVASDNNFTNIATSVNGLTWTQQTPAFAMALNSITYGNGLFVAVSSNSTTTNKIHISKDALTWQGVNVPTLNTFQKLAFGNNVFIIVAPNPGVDQILKSGHIFDHSAPNYPGAINGDIVVNSGSSLSTIANDAVTNAKAANMAANTIKGRTTGTGDPEDLTAAQVRTITETETTTQLNTRDTNNRNRTNHTGTQLAATISDFATAVGALIVDGSVSNEGSLTVGAGTGTTSIINSNTSGSTGVTLTAGTGLSIAEAGNVITLTNTGIITEVDGSTTNELQTISHSSDATSHTATLSSSGGSLKLIEGANVTLTTSGNEVTIASTGGSGGATITDGSSSFTVGSSQVTLSVPTFGTVYEAGRGYVRLIDAGVGSYFAGPNGNGSSGVTYFQSGNITSGTGTAKAADTYFTGGNGVVSNFAGGDARLYGGSGSGSGADGDVRIADTNQKLTFFEGTPVVKQSAATDLQSFYDRMVAYNLVPAATLSGGGGSGVNMKKVKSAKWK